MRNHFLLLGLMLCLIRPAMSAPPEREEEMRAKCEALLADWKERFDDADFNAIVAPPFVVAGNGSAAKVQRYTDKTVLAAARALQNTYFKTAPTEPVLILLFESEGPYKRLAKKWFGDESVPYFGFYRRSDNVMLMNIRTGTGTLVHEIVHALINPDFPDVPDWFNEGLASLYEQCSLNGDTITGHVNWRLPALQKAIQDDTLRPLKELIEGENFYAEDHVGINYAQSRYLMMYLQEKGLLTAFYTSFREGVKTDPTGYKSLEKTIGRRNVASLEKEWRAWVLELRCD